MWGTEERIEDAATCIGFGSSGYRCVGPRRADLDIVPMTYQEQPWRRTALASYRTFLDDPRRQPHDAESASTSSQAGSGMARSTGVPRCVAPDPDESDPAEVRVAALATTSDTPPSGATTSAARPQDASDVETLARRALGIAMNALYNGGGVTALGTHDEALVDRARALLRRRVPDGPERALALDLLDGASRSVPRSTAC